MAAATPELIALANQMVCVRVTDMRHVDLARYRFDLDLTFAALTADGGGHVYHRYGGRDAHDAESALSLASFTAFVRVTLEEHRARAGGPQAAVDGPPHTIEQLPSFRRRDAEKRVDCVHCHTVNDFEFREAVASGGWKRDQLWVYPDLARLGFEVERDDQQRVARVEPSSPAGRAGVAVGDRLLTLGGQGVRTRADVQWVLHHTDGKATELALELQHGEGRESGRPTETRNFSLALADGWKHADPREYAWRSYKWNLTPGPGFGGKPLDAQAKKALGLAPTAFAQEVGYLVTWGDKAATGRSAEAAGLKKGDILVAIAGQSDFESEDHFQAWFRLTQKPGETIALEVLRDGRKQTLKMKVVE